MVSTEISLKIFGIIRKNSNGSVRKKHQCLKLAQKLKPTPKPDFHPKIMMLGILWSVKGVVNWELIIEKDTITSMRCLTASQ